MLEFNFSKNEQSTIYPDSLNSINNILFLFIFKFLGTYIGSIGSRKTTWLENSDYKNSNKLQVHKHFVIM